MSGMNLTGLNIPLDETNPIFTKPDEMLAYMLTRPDIFGEDQVQAQRERVAQKAGLLSPAGPAAGLPKVSAIDAAQRMRRRAAAGDSGKVTTGTPTFLQAQVQAGGTPRTLIGR